ncbi:hypothetical protein C7974DRAFT_420684 [Boeremia exigua]|uniref:uncharacterized protein n=1 Tax=Boeremia exigua TaxID=749465 RepID=UPI001E8EC359|nr:uncharacterized protein C7974DRAFT_420684 [Boeremia exigua]KAH6642388.1 hypothetical protein C7974DRAFT_420684 [Boeremia exigua]
MLPPSSGDANQMDWDDFEQRAGRAIPDRPLGPRRCWIGVLLHDKDPQQPLHELDFQWMIGHSQRVSKFCLISRNGILPKHKILKEIMDEGSGLFVFRAVHPTTPSRSASSSAPSQQISHEASSPIGATGASHPVHRVPNQPQARNGLRVSMSDSNHVRMSPQVPNGKNMPIGIMSSSSQNSLRGTDRNLKERFDHNQKYSEPSRIQTAPVAPVVSASTFTSSAAVQPNSDDPTHVAVETEAIKTEPFQNTPFIQPNVESPSQTPGHTPPASASQTNSISRSDFLNRVEEEPSQPFDAADFFNREPSPEQDHGGYKPADELIRGITNQENPEVLEAGVQRSLTVLEEFKQAFSTHAACIPDAQAYVESIDKLIPQAKRKRTVVGVVGNTGAGKSSVINALLDEERLVPTNCMRACTAVVTEMSWNESKDPLSKYRAEVQFISRADWEKEVTMLMKEFLTENGALQREASDPSTDAGIAWAKFHAVHPRVARDELSNCTVAQLMSDQGLHLLGTTKMINCSSPQRFYQELQRYVDSKEKVTKKDKKDKTSRSFEMEYWPLIKVVKIYTKAPALSTGAVIVDLPGVHDSNAARAAVAQTYIKQCTGLWIVAPITRAVDDKAAKTLLGDSFKTQLKYDGGFSSVTFICSKTDDISITEAIDTLELHEEVESLYEQQDGLDKAIVELKTRIEDLKESQKVYQLAGREAADDIEIWEDLKDQRDDGKEVYAPAPKAAKRKKDSAATKSRKRHQMDDEDSDTNFVIDDEDAEETEDEASDEEVQAPQKPLTEDEINKKLKELRETKKTARREGLEINPQIEELRPRIREAQTKSKAIKAKISGICISGRNEYSKEAIQNDFAAGIKELDQENAAEEDEDNFNPDEEQRDYDQVARSLPVFCVSSRAYQKMCGRLQKDDTVPGFNTPEETGIPQLQAHCKKLTEAGRVQNCRGFLLSVCQLLTTFTIWASNDGIGLEMTEDDKQRQFKYINRRLEELEDGLEACIKACLNAMKREMNDQIFDKYPDLIQEAIAGAPSTAARWGAHRDEGGLLWATYKAVVRRFGVYHSAAAGHRDFNSELVEPIIKNLATGWERAFQNRLPKAFATFIADSGKILHKFHEAVEARARDNGIGLASLSTLKTQIHTYEKLFGELNQALIHSMTEMQREANRDFAPTILDIMQTAYQTCVDEHGPGSFKRMKAAMGEHVERNRHHMFNKATMTVKGHLDAMCRSLLELMEVRADRIYIQMKADYMRVLGGVQLNPEAVRPREERTLRGDIMERPRDVNSQFEAISNGELAPADKSVVEEHVAADDEESLPFASAAGSPDTPNASKNPSTQDALMQDAIMQDTLIEDITGASD